jgi:hypothetical protein
VVVALSLLRPSRPGEPDIVVEPEVLRDRDFAPVLDRSAA